MTVWKDIMEFWEESIQVLRLKRKYIPVLSHHVYVVTSSQTSCCITHWLILICPSFEPLHPGNYQTAVGFITSQVPLGTRARCEIAVPCGRCQKVEHICFQKSFGPNITLTLFHHLNIGIHFCLNKCGVQFICSDRMESYLIMFE